MGLAVKGKVREIGDQKDRGEEEGCEHGCTMLLDAAGSDVDEADEESNGAEGVEDCVEQGQRAKVGAGDVEWCVEVYEVANKRARSGADDNDCRDDAGWGAQV